MLSQHATAIKNLVGMNLIRESISRELMSRNKFRRLPSKQLKDEANVEPIKAGKVAAKDFKCLKAVKEALLVDYKAQALEKPQASEDLDLEVAPALLLSDHKRIEPQEVIDSKVPHNKIISSKC